MEKVKCTWLEMKHLNVSRQPGPTPFGSLTCAGFTPQVLMFNSELLSLSVFFGLSAYIYLVTFKLLELKQPTCVPAIWLPTRKKK